MKRLFIIIGIVIAVVGVFIFTSPKAESPAKSTTTKMTFQTIQDDVKNKAYLVDVRTPEEYSSGHFANAINFDSTKIDAGETPDLAKDAKIYLYCRTGRRAGESETLLKKAGYTNIINLGGLEDVEKLGGKLIK